MGSLLPSVSPGCRFILWVVAFHIVYHMVLQHLCRTIPHSLFYAPSMAQVEQRTEARIKYAERVMKRASHGNDGPSDSGSDSGSVSGVEEDGGCERKFCIGLVGTEVRLEYSYMLAAVGSLTGLGGVGSDCRTDKFFVQVRGKPSEQGGGEKRERCGVGVGWGGLGGVKILSRLLSFSSLLLSPRPV
jgi:hypothetical protein